MNDKKCKKKQHKTLTTRMKTTKQQTILSTVHRVVCNNDILLFSLYSFIIFRRGFYPKKYPRWKKISSMVKSYLTNLIHFMNQLTDPNMIIFLLKQTENMLGYFGPFPKLAKKFLKVNTIFVLTEFIRHSKYFLISSYEDVDC